MPFPLQQLQIIDGWRSSACCDCRRWIDDTVNAIAIRDYTGWPKNGTIILYALTLPNIKRFSKLFHCRIRRKFVIILLLKIPPHPKCVSTLPCEMSSVLRATIENKTTSVTTHFKKLTTGNNVFIILSSEVTVTSCSSYIKCSMYPPCWWTTHSSRRRH